MIDLDEDAWQREEEKRLLEKLKKYEASLSFLLEATSKKGEITLEEISLYLIKTEMDRKCLIPNTEIFKEIMVELIKNQSIDIHALKKEKREYIQEKANNFQLNEMLLDLSERQNIPIQRIEIYRLEDGKVIEFGQVQSEDGRLKRIRCSNVLLRVIREGEL